MTGTIGSNTGHGHVWPRPDGMKARCGGPGICAECSKDKASMIDAPFHMPAELVIALPMPPSTNNLFVNAGRKRVRSAEYLAWVKEAGYRLNAQRPPLMAGKVAILIEVEEPKTARRQDVANREKAVVDLLVSHRIIQSDDQRHVRELTMRWAPVEGVRITIRPAED